MADWKYSITLSDVWGNDECSTAEGKRRFVGVSIERLKRLHFEVNKKFPERALELRGIIDEFECVLNDPELSDQDLNNLMCSLWDWGDGDHIAYIDVLGLPELLPGEIKVYTGRQKQ